MKSQSLKVVLITLVGFCTFYLLQETCFLNLRLALSTFIPNKGLSQFITYIIIGVPIFIGLAFLHPLKKIPEALGLNRSVKLALAFALICTLPMLLGYAFSFSFNKEITVTEIIIAAALPALVEELFYRGFLFGQVFRYSRLGFLLAITFGATVFATSHLYQSQDLVTLVGIFISTFIGALLFAWVYVEWNYTIWVPIFLHFFMNLFWILFSVSDNAFGGNLANLYRFITIALIVGVTVIYKVKKRIPFQLNKSNLWLKKKA
jgi:membrane protease YdiL (CAAX protease family)